MLGFKFIDLSKITKNLQTIEQKVIVIIPGRKPFVSPVQLLAMGSFLAAEFFLIYFCFMDYEYGDSRSPGCRIRC